MEKVSEKMWVMISSQGGTTRNGIRMKTRLVQDQLFITPGRVEVEEGKQRFHVTGYTPRGPCGLRCSVRGPMSEVGNKEEGGQIGNRQESAAVVSIERKCNCALHTRC